MKKVQDVVQSLISVKLLLRSVGSTIGLKKSLIRKTFGKMNHPSSPARLLGLKVQKWSECYFLSILQMLSSFLLFPTLPPGLHAFSYFFPFIYFLLSHTFFNQPSSILFLTPFRRGQFSIFFVIWQNQFPAWLWVSFLEIVCLWNNFIITREIFWENQ